MPLLHWVGGKIPAARSSAAMFLRCLHGCCIGVCFCLQNPRRAERDSDCASSWTPANPSNYTPHQRWWLCMLTRCCWVLSGSWRRVSSNCSLPCTQNAYSPWLLHSFLLFCA